MFRSPGRSDSLELDAQTRQMRVITGALAVWPRSASPCRIRERFVPSGLGYRLDLVRINTSNMRTCWRRTPPTLDCHFADWVRDMWRGQNRRATRTSLGHAHLAPAAPVNGGHDRVEEGVGEGVGGLGGRAQYQFIVCDLILHVCVSILYYIILYHSILYHSIVCIIL